MRERNLYDTQTPYTREQSVLPPEQVPRRETVRTADGTYNDLDNPQMGSAGTRFGRNVPMVGRTYPAIMRDTIMQPNPRMISRELLTRRTFQPVTGLNLLAAAWIQFMIRDWFSHGKGDISRPWRVNLESNDHWPGRTQEGTMLIPRTPGDPTRTRDEERMPPTHANKVTH